MSARTILPAAVVVLATGVPVFAATMAASIVDISPEEGGVRITWHADATLTQIVERAEQLTGTADWVQVITNPPPSSGTNSLLDSEAVTRDAAVYRIRVDGAAQHPKVGQTAAFVTHYHGVSGTAEIVDEQTIRVTDFSYDGTGLLVYMIVSSSDSFSPYAAISGDLLRPTPYDHEALDFSLPPGVSLDDVNYISVWCVSVNISFGDGVFQ